MNHAVVIGVFLVVLVGGLTAEPPSTLLSQLGWDSLAGVLQPGLMRLAIIGAAGYASIVAAAWWRVSRCVHLLGTTGRARWVVRAETVVIIARFVVLAWLVVLVVGFGAMHTVRARFGDWPLVDELIVAAPALISLAALSWVLAPVERAVAEASLMRALDEGKPVPPLPTRSEMAWRHVRQGVLFAALPLMLLTAQAETIDLAWRFFGLPAPDQLIPVAQLAGAVGVLALTPPMLRWVLDTVSLEPGLLRDRLLAMAERHGVRCRDVLVWRTGNHMLNGAVIGFLPPLRYVLLTDALIERLHDDELDAVMAHELAHVRLRHMPWLAAAVLGAVALTGGLIGLGVLGVERVFDVVAPGDGPVAFALGVGAGGLTLVAAVLTLGFVSRRFEWQADAFAAKDASVRDPEADGRVSRRAASSMAHALARVAAGNAIPPQRFTWRHGSIAGRQRRLQAVVGRPLSALPQDRSVRVTKLIVACGFLAGIVLSALGGLG